MNIEKVFNTPRDWLTGIGNVVSGDNFDLVIDKELSATVMSVVVDQQLRIKFLVVENSEYPDLAYKRIKLMIYQKIGDAPKLITLNYALDKLVNVHTKLDGENGNNSAWIEQVYDYKFMSIENK